VHVTLAPNIKTVDDFSMVHWYCVGLSC